MAHVLVVDDDADIRAAMRSLLEDIAGHSVMEAEDGLTALALLRASEQRLVVLLDVLMPGLDGIGVLRQVAQDKQLATRHAYVLVTVSRRSGSDELAESLAIQVPVVSKPFDMDALLATVHKAERKLHPLCAPGAAPESAT